MTRRAQRTTGVAVCLCGAFALAALMPTSAGNPQDKERLIKTRECRGCDLANEDLAGQYLT